MALSSPSSAKHQVRQRPESSVQSRRQDRLSSPPGSSREPRSSPSMSTTSLEYTRSRIQLTPDTTQTYGTNQPIQRRIPSSISEQSLQPSEVSPAENDFFQSNASAERGNSPPLSSLSTSPTSFCYRHDPDTRCQRQGDGPTADNLQKELSSLSQHEQQDISNVWSTFASAPSRQRELILKGILAQCCFPQLSFVSASVRDLLKIDFLSALPPELGLRILCFLDPASLCKAAQVNKNWKELADDDAVWHRMCEQHIDRKCTKCGWGLPLLDRQRLRTEKRLLQLRISGHTDQSVRKVGKSAIRAPVIPDTENPYNSTAYMSDDSEDNEVDETMKGDGKKRTHGETANSHGASSSKKVCTTAHNYASDQSLFQPSLRPWKDIYRDRFRVGTNWKYGRSSMKVFKGHTDGVLCLAFDDNLLATGSYDSSIRIWDIETGEVLRTLTGHTMGVKCLRFDQSKLVSGSLDGTVKMWNMKTGQVIRTFPGHDGAVSAVDFDAMILASGSEDKTVRVRNFRTCSRVVLRGHTDWVNSVKVHAASQTLFSASDDNTVRMWDLEAKRCLRVFNDHVGQVQQVLGLPLDFELADTDESNGEEEQQIQATPTRTKLTSLATGAGRSSHPRYIVSASLDTTIKLWDTETGRCVRTFFGHMDGVLGLAADTLRVISGSNDGTVKIWDPRTGQCERTITGHAASVTCVGLSDRKLVSGSEDHEIRVYDFGH